MIATHEHALSKRRYAYSATHGGMAQFTDGNGATLCVPVNSGMMIPIGEREKPIRPNTVFRPHLDFLNASGKAKFDAMMFYTRRVHIENRNSHL